MAVSLNATPTSSDTEASAVTTVTVADLTIAAGSNIGLVATLVLQVGVSAVTCTWNGVSMTSRVSAANATNDTEVHIFVLRNPATGNHSLTASWTTASDAVLSGIAFNGVDQTSDTVSFPNATSATGNTATSTVTVTTQTNNAVVAVHGNGGASFASVDNTQLFLDNTAPHFLSAGNYKVTSGSASVTLTGTLGSAQQWVSGGIDALAATAGGGAVVAKQNFKVNKFKTPLRSMGPNAGLFQVRAFPISVSADTLASYVSRPFSPQQWNLNQPLLRGTAQDFSSSAVETNPHWRGSQWPAQWNTNRALQRATAQDFNSSAVETNPHWIGEYLPPQWSLNRALRLNTAQDFSSSAVETNPHWTGKPWPFFWNLLEALWQTPATDVLAITDTPPPFVSRTWPLQWAVNFSLKQNTAQDFSSSAVETNTHWLGKLRLPLWGPQASLLQNAAIDVPPVILPDTPPFFVPLQWSRRWMLRCCLPILRRLSCHGHWLSNGRRTDRSAGLRLTTSVPRPSRQIPISLPARGPCSGS